MQDAGPHLCSALCDNQVSLGISGNWWLLQCSCLPALSRRGQGDSALQNINKDKRGHGYQTEFSKALPWFPGLRVACIDTQTHPCENYYCHPIIVIVMSIQLSLCTFLEGRDCVRGLLFMNSCLPASIHSPYKHLLSAAFAPSATVQRTQDISPPCPWQHGLAWLSAVIHPRQWIPTQGTGCSICSIHKGTRQHVASFSITSFVSSKFPCSRGFSLKGVFRHQDAD